MKKQLLNDEKILMRLAFTAGLIMGLSAGAMEPPAMPQRAVVSDKDPPHGKRLSLMDGDVKFALFVPEPWQRSQPTLTIHFHTAEAFVIQEHIRRGATHPLATFNLGQGSAVYRRAFEDTSRFGRVLDLIEKEIGTGLKRIEVSSFSAGYGAVREIIKRPEYFERIDGIVLADSMYAALETNSVRRPLREQIQVWAPFARAAMQGRKTFVFTYSQVPTTNYASSSECAQALLAELGVRDREVAPNSTPAASDKEFPLLRRADVGRLHVWGYGGTNAQAHMTHPRHVADIWRAVSN